MFVTDATEIKLLNYIVITSPENVLPYTVYPCHYNSLVIMKRQNGLVLVGQRG